MLEDKIEKKKASKRRNKTSKPERKFQFRAQPKSSTPEELIVGG
jgi:hypothetical protein